ncbi:MAG: hypothetical protein QY302_14790 [Anaerolineales bacterium]|nr:MAG: hypothetical protein QY302_14790 [Anaerolineales bacterium]
MMEYKGYIGKVEFDDEAGILYGEVINVRDVIAFEDISVEEGQKVFQESVDVLDHLVIGQGKWVSLKERGLGFA